jgi:uncharacterized protein (DUF885 family)
VEGFDDVLPDYSPEGRDADAEFPAGALARLAGVRPIDEPDRVAAAVMAERLETRLVLEESGERARTFSVLTSPVRDVRQAFELMDTTSAEGLANVTARMAALPAALAGWRRTLEAAASAAPLARRHVLVVADQADGQAAGAYRALGARLAAGREAPGLEAAADAAQASLGELAAWMREVLVASTTEEDAVGAARYGPWARQYLGAAVDLDELYEWGWQDLSRINARMAELKAALAPGASSLRAMAERLDDDDDRCVFGEDEIVARLTALTESTTEWMAGTHFDIDERVRRCDVRIAPEGSAAAPYYIPPSEDLRRPGTTWLPTLGSTRFPWWRLVSIWYHEAVPGHHLEGSNCLLQRDRLSRYQRMAAWTSGYGEGWALYAERLMEELGAFSDPAEELGFLVGQGLRAARVVVDLGLHLKKAAPGDLGELGELGDCSGRVWDAEMAVALLEERALIEPAFARSEVDRYLGVPAQAISYKVGERAWLAARGAAKQRLGDRFDLKAFHRFALAQGPMGLDPFAAQMARWDGA